MNAGSIWDTVLHIVDGANWKTTLIISNLDTATRKYKLLFHGDDGTTKRFSIVGRGSVDTLSGEIPPRGSVTVETSGAGLLQSGWAELDGLGTDYEIGLTAIFGTFGIAGRPDFEATVPAADTVQYKGVLPFDNTRGFTTSIAVLNASPFGSSSVPVTITNESGALLATETTTLAQGNKVAFATPDRWPQTAGKRGSIIFSGTLTYWAVLGFRFNSGGAFTTLNLLEP